MCFQTVNESFSFHSFLHSLSARDYNSYGSRRGNDAVMARGTFANIRLFNKFLNKQAPKTIHLPTEETVSKPLFDSVPTIRECFCVSE